MRQLQPKLRVGARTHYVGYLVFEVNHGTLVKKLAPKEVLNLAFVAAVSARNLSLSWGPGLGPFLRVLQTAPS